MNVIKSSKKAHSFASKYQKANNEIIIREL